MKKHLLCLCLIPFLHSFSVSAQWTEYASGFSAPGHGINQIVTPNPANAWATAYDANGLNGTVRDFTRTTDGGLTWTAGTVTAAPTGYYWSCLTAIDENTAWAMFYNNSYQVTGGIYKTTDGGLNWSTQGGGLIYSTVGVSFPDVLYFWDANSGVAVGDPVNNEYEIYTTSNGGTTWTPVSGANIPDPYPGEYGITRVFAVRGNTYWFGTTAGRIFKSTDHGLSWTVLNTGFANSVICFDFADDNTGWVEIYDPYGAYTLYRTTDGGVTWINITPVSTFYWRAIAYVPNTNNVLVAGGYNVNSGASGSEYSIDGGDSWVNIDSGVAHGAVAFYNSSIGYCGGINVDATNGGMFKFTGSFPGIGLTVYLDADNDTYGDHSNSFFAEDGIIPEGYVTNDGDCNDANAAIHPGAVETGNGIDDNCNGIIDDVICELPVNLLATTYTATSAKLSWDASQGSAKYQVRYKKVGSTGWITSNLNGTTKVITGLEASTKYAWQVNSLCSKHPLISSGWTAIKTFTTANLRYGNPLPAQFSLQLYPNPAEEQTTLSFTLSESSHVCVKVYSLDGKEMETLVNSEMTPGDYSLPLQTVHFPAGIYMVRMIAGEGILNQKLIVQ